MTRPKNELIDHFDWSMFSKRVKETMQERAGTTIVAKGIHIIL